MITNYSYASPSFFTLNDEKINLSFSPDLSRNEIVKFTGILKNPVNYRDAMLCLRDVVVSDFRPPNIDRTDYLKWLDIELERLVSENILTYVHEKKAKVQAELTQFTIEYEMLKEQRKKLLEDYTPLERPFWNFISKRDHDLWIVLDPVISVHPDKVFFEAFSRDESSYANLEVDMTAFDTVGDVNYGTTNIDFSKKLGDEFSRIRTSKPFELAIKPEGFVVDTGTTRPAYLEKKIDLPESWIRGFLQVSSALAFPAIEFEIKPIDLYIICSFLRRHREKESPRSLRYELTPGKRVKVVLEPWETSFELTTVYTGKTATKIRTWGRRRLFLLERLLPYAKTIQVRLLGRGMPSFYRVFLEKMVFTLGLSGWTSNDWSGGVAFSVISGFGDTEQINVSNYLKTYRYTSYEDLVGQFKGTSSQSEINQAVGYLYRLGRAFFDITANRIRYRELSQIPFPKELTEPSQLEKDARDEAKNLTKYSSVSLEDSSSKLVGTFPEVKGKTELTLTEEGLFVEAKCQCPDRYKTKKSKPCKHLLALYIKYLNS